MSRAISGAGIVRCVRRGQSLDAIAARLGISREEAELAYCRQCDLAFVAKIRRNSTTMRHIRELLKLSNNLGVVDFLCELAGRRRVLGSRAWP
jgi:hypothetical protein